MSNTSKPFFELNISDKYINFDVKVVRFDELSLGELCAFCERGIFEVYKMHGNNDSDQSIKRFHKTYHMNLCMDCRATLLRRCQSEFAKMHIWDELRLKNEQ